MTANHCWSELVAQAESRDYTVQEYSRLGNISLLQLLVCACKHDISDFEAEDFVGLVKQFFCQWIIVVELLAHADKL